MHETGYSKPVHWDNPEGWERDKSGRVVGYIDMNGKTTTNYQVISLLIK